MRKGTRGQALVPFEPAQALWFLHDMALDCVEKIALVPQAGKESVASHGGFACLPGPWSLIGCRVLQQILMRGDVDSADAWFMVTELVAGSSWELLRHSWSNFVVQSVFLSSGSSAAKLSVRDFRCGWLALRKSAEEDHHMAAEMRIDPSTLLFANSHGTVVQHRFLSSETSKKIKKWTSKFWCFRLEP